MVIHRMIRVARLLPTYNGLQERAAQRLSDIMQDRIAEEEEHGSIDLYQHTSSKDWALKDQNGVQASPQSRVEIMQRGMGKKGRILVWTGLAVMLII
jgi:hypothetical protein